MKRLLSLLTSVGLGLGIIFLGTTCTALADEVPAYYVNQSQYVAGVYGKDNYGNELVVALYDNGYQDIAYIMDGYERFYGTYTVTPGQMAGANNLQFFNVSGITFTYFEMGNGRYIMADDGDVYTLEDISAYEVEQLR
ncbi:MAG: hypothetical protein J6I76_14270 [Oribacterium sp.]|nr:hypothetical protein [Oribacterium sp.]MCR5007255.1 hypothetical protein [Oribacterium sp.]